jgi:hypothetical protein
VQTTPCPACGRHVMRDGTVGVLVCSCGEVLEFPTDLEGPIRPKENDKRWFGTDGEREDVFELKLPEPTIPSRRTVLQELERRIEEQRRVEAEAEERRAERHAAYARLSAPYQTGLHDDQSPKT